MHVVLTVEEIAQRLGARFEGDGRLEITGVAGVRHAQPGEISFVANPRYAGDVAETRASAVVVDKKWDRPCPCALIRVDNPDAAFAGVAEVFAPPPIDYPVGVHPTAYVAEGVELGHRVAIGPHCVVEAGARIGDDTVLVGACYIGHGVTIGKACRCYPGVSIREYATIGSRVILHNGAVVGSDGFGYTVDEKGVRTKIPQIGTVEIGDDVEIGANSTIDRARFGVTRIGNGVKIDNLVQIAHNVMIGDHSVVVAQVGVAGSAVIGRHVIIAGQAGVAGHISIGDGAIVGGQSAVTKNVPPKTFVSGYPAMPHEKSTRLNAHIRNLPDLKKRVAEIEARVNKLMPEK